MKLSYDELFAKYEKLRAENRRLVAALEEIIEYTDTLAFQKRDTSSANHCASIADYALHTHGQMNTEKINKLIKLINVADSVVVDNSNYAMQKRTSHPIDEPENEVVYLEWEDDDGIYNVKITELGLTEATEHPKEGAFTCEDHEGTIVDIKLFKVAPLTW